VKVVEEKNIPQKPVLEILCSIQGALGEENQKVFAKASMAMGRTWARTIPKAESAEALMQKIAEYLGGELKVCGKVTFEKSGDEYILHNRTCYVCHGKLVKERHNITPACAISMFPVGALSENLKLHNVRMKEIRKPGPAGDCDVVYEIKS
jgi:hypothetical protein